MSLPTSTLPTRRSRDLSNVGAARTYSNHWIDGEWVEGGTTSGIDVIDPATEDVVAVVPDGTRADAGRAVRAAAAAQDRWARTRPSERARLLRRVADGIDGRAEEFAQLLTTEVGVPLAVARQTQVGLAALMAHGIADLVEHHHFEQRIGNSVVRRAPVGVTACITPWNVPLLLSVQKIFPALGAGCAVVHKPSELTPLHARLLAEVVAEADLPAGVFNSVVGRGVTVGRALASDPLVDAVSLTGSTGAGRDVAACAAGTLKRVHLELGGKNASLVLRGADLETAVRQTIDQALFNSGQACLQWSRLLVPQERHDEAVRIASAAISEYVVGDPRDPATDLGPLISAAARDRVCHAVETAQQLGHGELAHGSAEAPPGRDRGYYVSPVLFARTDPGSPIAQEELFGPVVCMIAYGDLNEALDVVNSTAYGLHGAVWGPNDDAAADVARRFRTGLVDVNGGRFNPLAPFGGVKQSGIGRECGVVGLEEFTETQSLQLPTTDGALGAGPRLRDVHRNGV